MQIGTVEKAVFLERPNRFIARILADGRETVAHVKNTGRCRELLVPGATVYVQRHHDPARRTPFSLIAVEKEGRLVNIDSQAPNAVFYEALQEGLCLPGWPEGQVPPVRVRREVSFGESRLDFCVEGEKARGFLEIKGVTLEENGEARFPDAPTTRGARHMEELERAAGEGLYAAAVFVIQMEGVCRFRPNRPMDPAFAAALERAAGRGVHILAYDCTVTPDSLTLRAPVPVEL